MKPNNGIAIEQPRSDEDFIECLHGRGWDRYVQPAGTSKVGYPRAAKRRNLRAAMRRFEVIGRLGLSKPSEAGLEVVSDAIWSEGTDHRRTGQLIPPARLRRRAFKTGQDEPVLLHFARGPQQEPLMHD